MNFEFAASLKAVQTHVKKLQDDNAALKETSNLLIMELDDLKQYTRRPNLRLYGVRNEKGESSGKVFKIVENVCKEVCPEMFKFGCPIDRAHRMLQPRQSSLDLRPSAIELPSIERGGHQK